MLTSCSNKWCHSNMQYFVLNFTEIKGIWNLRDMFLPVYNGLSKVSTNFLWLDLAGVGVILWKISWVYCCRPFKMCLQLLLLLEETAVLMSWETHAGLSPSNRDYITKTLRPLWKTVYIQHRKEVKIKSVMSMCKLRQNHWLLWLTYKKLIRLYLGFWLLVWYGILYVVCMVHGMWLKLVWKWFPKVSNPFKYRLGFSIETGDGKSWYCLFEYKS